MDRQRDGQGDSSIPPHQLGWGINMFLSAEYHFPCPSLVALTLWQSPSCSLAHREPYAANSSEILECRALSRHITVDSRYLALVGIQNSRARVKWFSRYLAKAPTREFRITDPHSQVFTSLKQYVER